MYDLLYTLGIDGDNSTVFVSALSSPLVISFFFSLFTNQHLHLDFWIFGFFGYGTSTALDSLVLFSFSFLLLPFTYLSSLSKLSERSFHLTFLPHRSGDRQKNQKGEGGLRGQILVGLGGLGLRIGLAGWVGIY